jgi:hypothetical protein
MPTLVDRLRAVAAASTDDSLAGLLWESPLDAIAKDAGGG